MYHIYTYTYTYINIYTVHIPIPHTHACACTTEQQIQVTFAQDVPTKPTQSQSIHLRQGQCYIRATFDFVNQNEACNPIADTIVYDVICITMEAPVKSKLVKQGSALFLP